MDNLSRDRGEKCIDLFAMRRGHLSFSQTVHRSLEFFAMIELRGDSEKVEGALEEGDFSVEARQPDIPHWLQPDLVERRGEIVGSGPRSELAKAVGKGESHLAFGAKGFDRVTQFLNFAETQRVVADPREQYFYARIVGCSLDPVKHIAQGRLGTDQQPQQVVLAGSFLEAPCEVNGQDDIVGERGHPWLQSADQQHRADREQCCQETDSGKKSDHETAHAVSRLRSAHDGVRDGRRGRRPPWLLRPARRGCRRKGRGGHGSRSRPRCRRHRRYASGGGSNSSALSSPLSAAAANPLPISTPLTALIVISARARSPSSLS